MKTYCGIDLHSNNNHIGIIDEHDKRLYNKKHKNSLEDVLKVLSPHKCSLKGVVIESTFNWYWLVDGLQENDYTVYLANPSAIKQYEGLKYSDDKWASFWLAHLLRLNILPIGYIYPKEDRPTRDLLRRRTMFVKHRTAQILSLKSMITRNCGIEMPSNSIKKFKEESAEELFESAILIFTAKQFISTINFLKKTISDIESKIKSQVKLRKAFEILMTTPGIGKILALTIMLEVGDISRFPRVSDYSSYSRCVESKKVSNGKRTGKNNSKNGNRYLAWAYVEAANFARRYCKEAEKFYQRKMAQTDKIIATKALANKLSKATYFMMRDQVPFDANKLFK